MGPTFQRNLLKADIAKHTTTKPGSRDIQQKSKNEFDSRISGFFQKSTPLRKFTGLSI